MMQKMEIQERLFALQDLTYREFQSKLMPTVDQERVIGVRTPALRKFAKELARQWQAAPKEALAAGFMDSLPHTYYEENNLHGFLIESMREFDSAIAALDAFLPYVDNWATCDLMRPKVFLKQRDRLLPHIRRWMASTHPYTIRFGIEMLMVHFLDDAFRPEYLDWVADLRSDEYYVNMMIAWFFATALAKQYDAALPYLEKNRLAVWTHNKTIQKAVESDRISTEQKSYLRVQKKKN